MSTESPRLTVYGRESEALRNYWLDKLSREAGPSNLILDYERPTTYACEPAAVEMVLPDDLVERLITMTKDSSFLIYTILLAALDVSVHKYTGSSPVVIGSPSRKKADGSNTKPNALVIINQVEARLAVKQLLLNVRETLLEAYAKQNYPFERLVEHLGLDGTDNRCPLFDIALRLDDIHRDLPELKNDITINFSRREKALAGTVAFNRKLFASESIEQFKNYYLRVLRRLVENTDATVGDVQALGHEDRRQLLAGRRDRRSENAEPLCVHELFEAQAERTPSAIALTFEGRQLTYAELNARANRLAHYLQERGVGPEVAVALCVEPSTEMIVALLGVLKAGGVYVPLPPTYPKERLAFMLGDVQAPVLLTQKNLAGALPEHSAEVVYLDSDWDAIAARSADKPISRVTGGNLVYIVYTSGSTGTPKGVMVMHEALASRVAALVGEYGLGPAHRMLQFVSLGFDAAAEEIFPALASGASLVLRKDMTSISAADLLAACEPSNVTALHIPPAYWSQIVDGLVASDRPVPRWVKLFITGGENVSPDKLLTWLRRAEHPSRFINAYGPTEATITATVYEASLDRGPECQRVRVPIGRPLSDTPIYVLDGDLRPVHEGLPGELYIGGIGLARGYFDRPDLTAEQFIPNPFADEPGARLYKTGDLARVLPGGDLDLLGRIDDQVKVRGYRIELGEIELLLRRHAGLRDAVAVVREDEPGNKRLAAYIVADEESRPTVSGLCDFLKQALPDYMVPSAFVFLDALPLTPNGKVDRQALPAPQTSRPELEQSFAAARTPAEQALADIWCAILGVQSVGVHDNFFELGGHSLLATQVVSRVRDTFRVEVPLRSIFEAPTVAQLAQAIEAAEGEGDAPSVPPMVRVSREGELPLSFAQQRLWFLDQLYPASSLYNIPAAVRMTGRLDLRAFERTLAEVRRRHEVLRTRFAVHSGKPVQVIEAASEMRLSVADLSELSEEQREAEARRLAVEEAGRGFDLSEGPMLRVRLLRLGEEEQVVLVTMHHIVSDGWSMEVMIREVATLYQAFSKNLPSPLAELPLQYADFAAWQQQWLQGEVLEAELDYWRKQLAGAPSVIQLPSDRPRPLKQSFRGGIEVLALPQTLAQSLRALSQREGATLFVTLLAAFQTLLSRYTGQDDIVVGTDVANRNRVEVEALIGFFINQLVLRADLSGDPTFEEVLRQVRAATLAAYEHQDVPFEKLVEIFKPERDLAHAPLFQVKLVLQNAPRSSLELSELTLSPFEFGETKSQLDLSLFMWEIGDELIGSLIYDLDLFDQPTVARLLGHFTNLLEGVVANPGQRVSQLPLLTDAERLQLLREWNHGDKDYARDECIHQLFEAQAERRPEATAVVFGGERLTYGHLNRCANQLANALRKLGVEADVRVALYLERSPEMLLAILGILKAGGSYLPLDPAYPKERLAFILDDSRAPVLVTRQSMIERLPEHDAAPVYLDADWQRIAQESDENPAAAVTRDHSAYVIYTSGSTGRPKGVLVSHANVTRLFEATWPAFRFTEEDVWTLFHSYAFDFSVWEVWGALLYGGQLVVTPYEVSRSPESFYELLRDERVTVLNQTPSAFGQLIRAEEAKESKGAGEAPCLRLVIFGGEALELQMLKPWFDRHGDEKPELVNMYGITETTVHVTRRSLTRADLTGAPGSVIGSPIPDLQVYLLDRYLQLVPVGVPGEMYVAGAGLARGYCNRPALTAERFVVNPFSDQPGARLYKTGDLARYLPDGDIQYLGRVDHQVKVRGFRIELGEIESVINRHPAIAETVVIARDDLAGGRRLIAYLVANSGAAPSASEVRRLVEEKLPDYMVPSAFVFLDALPLTSNGKVDRRALPAPEQSRPELEEAFVAPRNEIEEMLAGVWARTLGVERVGAFDNFFELGGHSLLATQAISQIREAFGVEVPLVTLFNAPTVAAMAESVDRTMREGRGLAAQALKPVPREGPLALSFAQQRLWLVEKLNPGSPAYNLPQAVRLTGPLNFAAMQRSLDALIERHEVLRTTFSMVDGEPVQVIAPELSLPIPLIDLSELPAVQREAEARRLADEDATRLFDLGAGPLLRVSLARLGEHDHVAMFTLHHIIFDGWSSSIFVREIAALHERFSTGRAAPLAPLPIQYADFAHWQREWLRGDVLETQLAYWKRQLADLPTLEMPTDRPRPPLPTYRGGAQFVALSKALTETVRDLSLAQSATPFMTLLAAFQVLLHYYSGQEDVVVGTDVANRNRGETEGLIGFFINQLVLRADLSGDPTFAELLARVRAMTLDAYAHQDLPFEKVVEALRPERNLSLTPLFQVKIVFQNVPRSSLELNGLSVTPFEANFGAVKFDLLLNVVNAADSLLTTLMYNADLYDDSTIKRMLAHLETLLNSVVARPDCRLKELVATLAESEKRLQKLQQQEFKEARRRALKGFRARPAGEPELKEQEAR